MRVLLTGSAGQLGRELIRAAPADVTVIACTRADLDIADARTVGEKVSGLRPDIVINAAAYTAVDKAEADVAGARAGNVAGAANIAEAAARIGARLLHLSSDYVFGGGGAVTHLYQPADATAPLNAYGRSKAEGEVRVLSSQANALVVRSSWIYSQFGVNFVKTMLRLCRERPQLQIVADQVGVPTWAAGLARCLWMLARRPECVGIRHYCDAGVASWYDFAVAIRDEALQLGLIAHRTPIVPIRTAEFPAPAPRPCFSVLDARPLRDELGLAPVHWREHLTQMLAELVAPGA
jgi:dTDP-4-dehydrorhamnose reductase